MRLLDVPAYSIEKNELCIPENFIQAVNFGFMSNGYLEKNLNIDNKFILPAIFLKHRRKHHVLPTYHYYLHIDKLSYTCHPSQTLPPVL